jgi:hypothetical protein
MWEKENVMSNSNHAPHAVEHLQIPMEVAIDAAAEAKASIPRHRTNFVTRVMLGEVSAKQIIRKYSREQQDCIINVMFSNIYTDENGVEHNVSTVIVDLVKDNSTITDAWVWKHAHTDEMGKKWYNWQLITEGEDATNSN